MFLYIFECDDNTIKIGSYEKKENYGKIRDDQQYCIKKIYPLSIYEINETSSYKLPFSEYKDIISVLAKNPTIINKLSNQLDIKLYHLYDIKDYMLTEWGHNVLHIDGLNKLTKVIEIEFKLLGLKVRKFTEDELAKVNTNLDNDLKIKQKEEEDQLLKFIADLKSK